MEQWDMEYILFDKYVKQQEEEEEEKKKEKLKNEINELIKVLKEPWRWITTPPMRTPIDALAEIGEPAVEPLIEVLKKKM